MTVKDFEIMAPVGSYESLTAAIQGGAGSIYFGVEGLNMRARSSNNFTLDDLREIARICRENGMKSYLTVNTVMHRTHLPLTKWFWAIYLVACDKRGISALALAGKISVSYETAWYLLCRIRKAMEARDAQYTLGGIIEFDDSYFGAKIKGKGGRGAGNQGVFVAVGKDEAGRPEYLKMLITPNIQIPSVKKFVDKNLETGSVVETDGFRSYRKPLADNYTHQAEDFSPDSEHLKWLHRIIGNAKAFINGTYHGTSSKHLQMYLSEFCYRFNRRSFGGVIFDRLLVAIAG